MTNKADLNRRIQELEQANAALTEANKKLTRAAGVAEREIAELKKGVKLEIDYPRDFFQMIIQEKSPYAFYLHQWVPYQTDANRWRLKMNHDVKTFDGREAHGVWPNGEHCGPFKDDEVEFIRISRKQGI